MEHEDTTSVALVPLPTLETLDYASLPLGAWEVRTVTTACGPRTYRFYRTIFGTFYWPMSSSLADEGGSYAAAQRITYHQ